MAIISAVVAVRRGPLPGTDCDCLSEGLKSGDSETTVQCTWQPRGTGAVGRMVQRPAPATVWERPAWREDASPRLLARFE